MARILRIEPGIRGVTVRTEDVVRLGVDVYGVQDILDNSLADGKTFDWDDGGSGSSIEGTGRVVVYTAPSSQGTYKVTVVAAPVDCRGTEEQCMAEFEVRVRRSVPPPPTPATAPVNPEGEIPTVLTDSDGEQYEVFTPVEGGSFQGESFSITAGAGAVPDGEVVGLRMSETGPASNVGMTAHRYMLVGNSYAVSTVDPTGAAVTSYRLNAPLEVCVPLPEMARSNISDVALVVTNADGSLTVLSASVRLSASSTSVCGTLSSVPATLAVGTAGAPSALPNAALLPTPEAPDTGGTAPRSSSALLWLMLIAIGALALGVLMLDGRPSPDPPKGSSGK